MFSVEKGIDVYRTAKGSGWSIRVSMLAKYYGVSNAEIFRRMDEIQIENRLADLPKLQQMERQNIGLAVWGPKKKDDNDNRRGRGRRGR